MPSDIRFALRQLAKSPGFACVAVATLGLGIGACAVMFSILDAVLLRPLPFREPDRLVWIENDQRKDGLSGRTTRADVFTGWRENSRSFEALGAYFAFFDYERLTLTGAGEPLRLRGVGVSDNFLAVLGVPLLHGRNFTPEESTGKGPRAVILGHGFWQRRFASDPGVVGRSLALNDAPSTVVGVLPPSFDFDAVFAPGTEVDVLTPFPINDETAKWGNTLLGIGRLRAGVSVAQADEELKAVSRRLQPTLRGTFGADVLPLAEAVRGRFRRAFLVLAGAVACVLAIACVNLSNLLLTRANARRQEYAVRAALGASRLQIARQALAESLVLSVAGALVGLPVAVAATRALARLETFGVPLLQDARIDPTGLAVTLGLALLAGLLCGLLPALALTRADDGSSLRGASHQRTAGRSAAAARGTLVVAEVALASVLLVGAGLLIRSFDALLREPLGFATEHAVAWRVDPPRPFATNAEATGYFDAAVRRVAELPGVESVGLGDTLPLGRNRTWGAAVEGVQYAPGEYPLAFPRVVDHRYLHTMRIPLVAGRYLDAHDDAQAPRVVVVNETLARRNWPDRDPLGQRLVTNGGACTVVGVVGNVRHGALEEKGGSEMYLDYRQNEAWAGLEMVVRSSRPLASLVPEVRGALAAHDPSLPSGEFYPLERLVDNAVAPRRLVTRLLGFFSALALTLAALGLYGVVAYSVVQRRQEIGIRMAIGARRDQVISLVMAGGLKLVVVGIILGALGALATSRLLSSLLFGVTGHDPLVLAGNAALLLGVGALACALPALRAARLDPLVTLRAE
jgi:putative ABC transport system permease protein